MNYYQESPEKVLEELRTTESGLSHQEAGDRLAKYGPNKLAEGKKVTLLQRFIQQLCDPMIIILLVAAAVSGVTAAYSGESFTDVFIILIVVLINAVLGVYQESKAEKAIEALQEMTAATSKVLRDGKMSLLRSDVLVPGDIVILEAGDAVPADCRILESASIKAEEAALTGESVPVEKDVNAIVTDDEVPLGDRHCMLYMGSTVVYGRGRAVVCSTGMDTEMGKIADALAQAEEGETPLQRKLGQLSKVLSVLVLGICVFIFLFSLLRAGDFHLDTIISTFMVAVSLAVAAIPEGLAAVVTIVLSIGVTNMSKRNAVIRRLTAVETLGCAQVICSDKTGTLTQNKMTVVEVWTPRPSGRETALTIAALCSDAELTWRGREPVSTGDPTEAALVTAAAKEGLDKNELEGAWPRRGELPFDSERKLMTTVHAKPGGGYRVCVKGAPDVLSRRCRLDSAAARRLEARNEAMASRALRVLGVAYKDLALLPAQLSSAVLEQGLTFAGLIGMIDPPRPEVKAAVERCFAAGIRPVMITGDHKLTAVAIARELGICRPGDLALTGDDLDFLPQEVLEEEVDKFSVYARVSPEHKMRIVQAWQARGKVAAMTGDGVNDAPALKAADIGCAMGLSGTDVAKGAADMILTDDNFATIVAAVEEGRGIYANIKKAIHYLLSCNIGEILTIFCATLFRFPQMPLVPVQLLWLNLVTDSLPALALGVEPVEEGAMSRPPRDPHASLFAHGFAARLAWQGAMVGALTLAAWLLGGWVLPGPAAPMAAANTMAFATLTLSQLFHAFDVRSEEASLFHIGVFSNPAMNRAFLIGLVMQLAVLCVPPLQAVFGTVPMSPLEWATVLALAVTPVAVCECAKAIARRRARPKKRRPAEKIPAGRP